MPTVQFREWSDFRRAGINMLTGEACGLSLRILCDVTEKGRLLFCKALGLNPAANKLGENWNGGPKDDPHVGSVMLSRDMLPTLSIFAALETPDIVECYVVYDKGEWVGTYGFNAADKAEHLEQWLDYESRGGWRPVRYAYGGTAGDRNVHQFSGRVS